MADTMKPKAATPVRATTHPGDTRANIPTAELESFARPEEKRPTIVRYPRDLSLDPSSSGPEEDALSIHAQMTIVRQDGLKAARHLIEDIYEVEAHGIDHSYRLLFSSEGKKGRILLAVVLIEKKTQKTPKPVIELARKRRDDWRGQPQPQLSSAQLSLGRGSETRERSG